MASASRLWGQTVAMPPASANLAPIQSLRVQLGANPEDAEGWEALAAACGAAGLPWLARAAGKQSLALQRGEALLAPLPLVPRPAAAAGAVLSVCLRSPTARGRAAVLATLLRLPELLPGWQLQLHVASPLPPAWLEELRGLGADLRLPPSELPAWLWPFAHLRVQRELAVGRFLLLDDAHPLTPALAGALRDWQAGGAPLQVHRWRWHQASLVPLAGLAAQRGALPDLLGWLQQQPDLATAPLATVERQLGRWIWAGCSAAGLCQWDPCFGGAGAEPGPGAGDDGLGATWLQPWLARFGLTEQPASQAQLLQTSLPWPEATEQSPPHGPSLTGVFINLDAQQGRRQRLEGHLARLPWARHYRRFPALTATPAEASALGLASAGELGIWRSLLAVLHSWLQSEPPDHSLLHILEDDAVLHGDLAASAGAVFAAQTDLDVLFTEAFLTADLYLALLAERQRLGQAPQGLLGLVDGRHYLACLSSWCITASAARRLHRDLQTLLAAAPTSSGRPLPPVDLAIRGLIRSGRLRAAITLPFLSTIVPDDSSAIQTGNASLRRAQRLDLELRRLLYAGDADNDPNQMLSQAETVLSQALQPAARRELFGVNLRHGRSRSWLPEY